MPLIITIPISWTKLFTQLKREERQCKRWRGEKNVNLMSSTGDCWVEDRLSDQLSNNEKGHDSDMAFLRLCCLVWWGLSIRPPAMHIVPCCAEIQVHALYFCLILTWGELQMMFFLPLSSTTASLPSHPAEEQTLHSQSARKVGQASV